MGIIIETSENQKKELYQTHYFKASYDELKNLYIETIKGLKHNLLSVNDDYKELTMISNELKKNNFDVVSVMNENDCMDRLISKDKYDIVLVDDEMKDIAAVNLIEEIDKLGLDNLIKIVI